MLISQFLYQEIQIDGASWTLNPLQIRRINLIVGRNSSGKSRTVGVMNFISRLICGRQREVFGSAKCQIDLLDQEVKWVYQLEWKDGRIQLERLSKNGETLLDRGVDGIGSIFAEKEGKSLTFQTPDTQIAVINRQDNIQHSFLQKIIDWADSVFFYPFGTPLGQNNYVIVQDGGPEVDQHDAQQLVGIYRSGFRDYKEPYRDLIIRDMKRLGYKIVDIGLAPPSYIRTQPPISNMLGIYILEEGISGKIEQVMISQGMFRAMSLLAQMHRRALDKKPQLIIIDDIGEGLDYSRSKELIDIIIEFANNSNTQVIATTNDRFVMNEVDLEYWTILDRLEGTVQSIDKANSAEVFEDFKFTGLSNFDFFSKDYFQKDSAQ